MSRKTAFPRIILPCREQSVLIHHHMSARECFPPTACITEERSQARSKTRLIESLFWSVDEWNVHLIVVHFDQTESTEENRTSPVELQGTTGDIVGMIMTVVDEIRGADDEIVHRCAVHLVDEVLEGRGRRQTSVERQTSNTSHLLEDCDRVHIDMSLLDMHATTDEDDRSDIQWDHVQPRSRQDNVHWQRGMELYRFTRIRERPSTTDGRTSIDEVGLRSIANSPRRRANSLDLPEVDGDPSPKDSFLRRVSPYRSWRNLPVSSVDHVAKGRMCRNNPERP